MARERNEIALISLHQRTWKKEKTIGMTVYSVIWRFCIIASRYIGVTQ
jgi:hypothetical protein